MTYRKFHGQSDIFCMRVHLELKIICASNYLLLEEHWWKIIFNQVKICNGIAEIIIFFLYKTPTTLDSGTNFLKKLYFEPKNCS